MKQKIGFIGLGIMGRHIAEHILKKDNSLNVWSRDTSKSIIIQKLGAKYNESPKAMALEIDILVLCVTDHISVEEILFGENGFLINSKRHFLIIDHSTMLPCKAQEIAKKVEGFGSYFFDAPVTGSVPGAVAGTLTTYVGGHKNLLGKIKHVLKCYSSDIKYIGISGLGQSTKLCNQILLINTILMSFEVITFAEKQGMNGFELLKALGGSFVESRVFKVFAETALTKDRKHKFAYLKDVYKDISYIVEIANKLDSKLIVTKNTFNVIKELINKDYGNSDVTILANLYK